MLPASALKAVPGERVLDLCAAPGGKSSQIALAMGGEGVLVANEVDAARARVLAANLERLGVTNAVVLNETPARLAARWPGYFDAVLVDAPCSGLGVIADKPDIKYRFTDAQLETLLPLQAEILENCARFVKVGGLLVYSTCTILPEENEKQVRAFLERHPEFVPETGADYLPEPLRCRCENGMAQLLSHRDHVEGFFIARMRRKGV